MRKMLCLMGFIAITLAGCSSVAPVDAVTVTTAEGQNVALTEIDAANDTLIERKIDEDIDFAMERTIFAPLLADEEIVRIPWESVINISLLTGCESAVLYEHLLKEDGTSYFNRTITTHELEQKNTEFTVGWHIGAALSSDSRFLAEGSIRGFRLVFTEGGEMQEYAFVLYVEGPNS